MKRVALIVTILLLGSQMVFAAADPDTDIPTDIRNNKFFLESVRLTNIANQAYEEGDYDASSDYSAEAVRYANLSDEFVRLQLKKKECDDAIAAAKRRMDFAASVSASTRYPGEYNRAQSAYTEANNLRSAEKWDEAIAAANQVLTSLALVTEPGAPPVQPPVTTPTVTPPVYQPQPGTPKLPAQYTVRDWNFTKDCLWNIAGRPYVYNDPRQWRLLYDANKAKLSNPNNPDLIDPGLVLTIPSIRGEAREGMWNAYTTYPTFR